MMNHPFCYLIILLCLLKIQNSTALSHSPIENKVNVPNRNLSSYTRRSVIKNASQFGILCLNPLISNSQIASADDTGLASRLSKRDASLLRNSPINIPPQAQVYPEFMRGNWKVEGNFRGFVFPSKSIANESLVSKPEIPGFQKCSIAQVCDVGKENLQYYMKIDPNTGLEDRTFNFEQVIDANLGYKAIENVIYDNKSNPNRISIVFVKSTTRNAERIELFCNARESELVLGGNGDKLFVCSEQVKQVTFSLSQEFGVARQVVGNYANYWTWKQGDDPDVLVGNLLTAAYLDPNDPLFFQEPSKPVVVYSQDLKASRIK